MKMIRKALSVLLTIGIIVGLAPTMMPSAGAENFIGYDWLTEVVSLDIPIYFQTGDNTCGSASAVMVLRYLAQKGEISFGNSITDISFRGDDSPIEPAPLAERMNNYDTALQTEASYSLDGLIAENGRETTMRQTQSLQNTLTFGLTMNHLRNTLRPCMQCGRTLRTRA